MQKQSRSSQVSALICTWCTSFEQKSSCFLCINEAMKWLIIVTTLGGFWFLTGLSGADKMLCSVGKGACCVSLVTQVPSLEPL